MDENKSILHELYVYSEWKPEPEYIQKPDGLLPENISVLWRWIKFLGPKKSLIDSVTAHKEKQQKWHIALGEEGKVIAVLTDNILEIRTKRSDYATIAARTTVSRDAYSQWRKLVWSPDCTFIVVAYGNGVVSFFDLTASNLFNIPIECSRPGGMECTDNTHAVADIIFMPLRVKDTKWSWEVLIVNYDGKIRGYLVSQMDGFSLHHRITFGGGVGAAAYCHLHAALYVAGVPKPAAKDPDSAQAAGITAWRVLNDEPYYKLSVVSDQFEQGNEKFQFYIPFVSSKNLAFVVQMVISPDSSKLVCLHCNGDVSIWRLPTLKLLHKFPLSSQPEPYLRKVEDKPGKKDVTFFHPADVNWWSNEELILSRFSGSVSVNCAATLRPLLARRVFLQGAPRVSRAVHAALLALECEASARCARRTDADHNQSEVVPIEDELEDSMFDTAKELLKYLLFAITDIETFQPRPRRVTCVARVYRLLAVKSTTPTELFSTKIESGAYSEALKLASTFSLDSDLVYQQQWRKNPVSAEAIDKYLSKVSKKIWAVHQCVDRLPETLPAAKELLQFGLELTDEKILEEINKERAEEEEIKTPDEIVPEHLNAYTSELLRCRHVMLFYRERLYLYESILKYEKSKYVKDEYDRLRSNSVMRSSIEIAKEGRIKALTCLWPHINTMPMKLAVLENLPETINPMDYQHLLPTNSPQQWFETKSPIKVPPMQYELDWCRKEIFRSIWSSNWSEETTPDTETNELSELGSTDIGGWYTRRAREIAHRSGLVSHALTLTTLATGAGNIAGLDTMVFHLLTLDTLVYDRNEEGVTLEQLEKMSTLETCSLLMKTSTVSTFVSDLKTYVIPFLTRYEELTQESEACLSGLIDYLESIAVDDLAPILLLLKSQDEYKLELRIHLDLVERCLLAHAASEQLDIACDLLDTILQKTDSSISSEIVVERVSLLQRLVAGWSRLAWRGTHCTLRELRHTRLHAPRAHQLLTGLARDLPHQETKPTPNDWEKLLKDILELQSTLFDCITKEQCYEIYSSALLTSGDAPTIRLAGSVMHCAAARDAHNGREPRERERIVRYDRTVQLVLGAAREYFNSASALNDPALELARGCLTLIRDGHPEIQEELDLISALHILYSFNLTIIPIQVRLCEDKMTLIEDCLKSDPNAFLASHKLLKLATLLRISGDDEIARESSVLELVCSRALEAGAGGGGAGVAAARRLAALRRAPLLLAAVARSKHAHADTNTRRELLAAAAASAPSQYIEDMLADRLKLELESLQCAGVNIKETHLLQERCPSTDDEYADAITTPIIEKKDLVTPTQSEGKMPLFNYLLDTFQNTFSSGDAKPTSEECAQTVHVPEFYQSLYPEHDVWSESYRYDRFSLPDSMQKPSVSQNLLKWFYIQNCLEEDGFSPKMEEEVVSKCAEALIYADTALGVACAARGARGARAGRRCAVTSHTAAALAAQVYAASIAVHASTLKDNVYLTKPLKLAEMPVKESYKYAETLAVIETCISGLHNAAEARALRRAGLAVDAQLFHASADYRREIVYRMARSGEREQLELSLALAQRYQLDPLAVWIAHAAAAPGRVARAPAPPAADMAHTRILEGVYPSISGTDYPSLLQFFTVLKTVDEKPLIHGLTAAEHIKLLKKAKAASPELDYKLLTSQCPAEAVAAHLLRVLTPDSVGMVGKFLRTLPPQLKLPVSINQLYTKWLTKYFFSVSPGSESSKKWMQQYRQCASYFNKLSKEELLNFVNDTCFSDAAVERVPSCTRNLMIMQAVDYCQQEQENDFKFNKNEQTWAQVGQELTRWARFLENFHSAAVQNIIDNSNVPRDEVWPVIERSHGERSAILPCAGELVLRHDVRPALLTSLLQCLHVDISLPDIFTYIHDHCLDTVHDTQCLVSRVTSYSQQGVSLPAALVARCAETAAAHALPPHAQLALLAIQGAGAGGGGSGGGDESAGAAAALQVLREHWPVDRYVADLTERSLASEAGQRAAVRRLCGRAPLSLQQKKALVDVLMCWPPTRTEEPRCVHSEFLRTLLTPTADRKEALVYIRLLLRQPILNDEEIKWLIENVSSEAVPNMIWIILLNKCIRKTELIVKLLHDHKQVVQKQEIEDTLIKELLEQHMLVPLVPTILYPCVAHYVLGQAGGCAGDAGDAGDADDAGDGHSVRWAVVQLVEAKCLAEAGHLFLLASGVPAPLRGFSQTIKFCHNMDKFEHYL